jgi:intracellular septation protein
MQQIGQIAGLHSLTFRQTCMKLLLDFLPVILFFGTFKYANAHKEWAAALASQDFGFLVAGGNVGVGEAPVILATVVVVVATLLQVLYLKVTRRKVDLMLWISLTLVVVLGGATIWFHNETFIKWKPSVLYWAMGLSFWLGQVIFRRNLLRMMLGDQIQVPDHVWHRLNFAWIAFFGLMGLLNLWVAYSFPTETWVNFKLFGGIGLMFVFTLAQGLYLGRYLRDDDAARQG